MARIARTVQKVSVRCVRCGERFPASQDGNVCETCGRGLLRRAFQGHTPLLDAMYGARGFTHIPGGRKRSIPPTL